MKESMAIQKKIERKEFWGTTKASSFACFGFLLGVLGGFLTNKYNITFLLSSILGLSIIGYALKLNWRLGFNVKWRLANFIIHIGFFIAVITGSIFIFYYKI